MPSFKILSRKTFIIHVFLRCATQTVSRHTNVTKAQQPHNFCPRFSPPSHTATPPHSLTRYAYLRHAPGWATTGFRRPSLPLLSQRLTTYEPLHGSPTPTPIQPNLHHNYAPYKHNTHNTHNTTTHSKNTANASHTPPPRNTPTQHAKSQNKVRQHQLLTTISHKHNHTADTHSQQRTPHVTSYSNTTHHACNTQQPDTHHPNHTPYDIASVSVATTQPHNIVASDSQATQRPSTLNQGGSVPEVHVSR